MDLVSPSSSSNHHVDRCVLCSLLQYGRYTSFHMLEIAAASYKTMGLFKTVLAATGWTSLGGTAGYLLLVSLHPEPLSPPSSTSPIIRLSFSGRGVIMPTDFIH